MDMKLAVIEGRWDKRSNCSVKPFFDTYSDVTHGNHNSFHYETFGDAAAFSEIVQRVGEQRGIRYVYVAAHGSDEGIFGASGALIPNKVIIESLKHARLDGVFFGACEFGVLKNARKILRSSDVALSWVAGYGSDVDWIRSSLADILFWRKYLETLLDEKKTPKAAVRYTAEALVRYSPGMLLIDEFEIFLKDAQGDVELLMRDAWNDCRAEFAELEAK